MKRIVCSVLIILCLSTTALIPVSANEYKEKFCFELSVEGLQEKVVQTGDIITIILKLKRTDSTDPYTMYAMQDEIRYDSTFFELVEDSQVLSNGIETTDLAMVDRYREFYMNYLSMSGGTQWNAETFIGSVQLKVIGESGVTKITSQDYLVSLKDGSGSYTCDANELTIILSTDCTVKFMTNGGTEVKDQIVQYGEKIKKPENPKRKGYQLAGWFTDINLTDEWDFDNDVVQSNMTLYAKWVNVEKTVSWSWPLFLLLLFIIVWKRNQNKQDKKSQ